MAGNNSNNKTNVALISFAFLLFFTIIFSQRVESFSVKPFKPVAADTTEIAFVADTQAPLWVETLKLKRNHNEKATEMIFKEILATHPRCFFILGDIVSWSGIEKNWNIMDKYLRDLRAANIPVYACLGNHEYLGSGTDGQTNFQKRFPNHHNTGYVEIVDSIAVVLMNSNIKVMSPKDTAIQNQFYKETLKRLDADPAIQYIIVGCHHPPYTNSSIVNPSKNVMNYFVPLFLRTKKCKLFITGHSHNFEYFKRDGKDFVIVGGGGGLHQPLVKTSKRIPDSANGYDPMFHYLTIKRFNDHLQLTSHQLKEDFSGFENGFTFAIQKP
jgi:predicted MPP superfamily phosphohydrolase